MSFAIGSFELILFVVFLVVTSGEAYLGGQATNSSYARAIQGILIVIIALITQTAFPLDLGVIVLIIGIADIIASKFPNLVPLLDPTLG